MVGRGKVGRDQGGLMHTQFIRWLGIVGRGKVGRDWGGERNTQFSFQTHFDYALFHSIFHFFGQEMVLVTSAGSGTRI